MFYNILQQSKAFSRGSKACWGFFDVFRIFQNIEHLFYVCVFLKIFYVFFLTSSRRMPMAATKLVLFATPGLRWPPVPATILRWSRTKPKLPMPMQCLWSLPRHMPVLQKSSGCILLYPFVFLGFVTMRYDEINMIDTIWYNMIQWDIMRYNMIQWDELCFDSFRCGLLRLVPGRGLLHGKDKGLQDLKQFMNLVDQLVPKNLLAGLEGDWGQRVKVGSQDISWYFKISEGTENILKYCETISL